LPALQLALLLGVVRSIATSLMIPVLAAGIAYFLSEVNRRKAPVGAVARLRKAT
jgi:hypothetical protein